MTYNQTVQEGIRKFIEAGAPIEHDRWAKWQAYLHSKCVEHENGKGEWVCFPSERMQHWNRQIETPYADLSEKEKESDRAEVRSYIPLLEEFASLIRAQTLEECVVALPEAETTSIFHSVNDGDFVSGTQDEYRKKALTALSNLSKN